MSNVIFPHGAETGTPYSSEQEGDTDIFDYDLIPVDRQFGYDLLLLVVEGRDRMAVNIVKRYIAYMGMVGRPWYAPDLRGFVELERQRGVKDNSLSTYYNTLRGVYNGLMEDEIVNTEVRAWFLPAHQRVRTDYDYANHVKDQLFGSIREVLAEKMCFVNDKVERQTVWLTVKQKFDLIAQPHKEHGTTLLGLRDGVMILTLLEMGLKSSELVALQVEDLTHGDSGHLAMSLPRKLIPYPDDGFLVEALKNWLQATGITDGPVFRKIFNGKKKIGTRSLNPQVVEANILSAYPIEINGPPQVLKPHDLRATCAQNWLEQGMDKPSIALYMGVSVSSLEDTYLKPLDQS